jgi:glycosyltransferase involved in cell wall biosynthesis
MASLWKGYGIYEVLQAFEIVVKQKIDVTLEVIGKGEEYECVKAWVREHKLLDSVRICGFVAEPDLNAHFSKADVFVSPIHDTLQDRARCPSKIFYYIPYQKPIVTCKIGNPADVLGEHGFYYRPDDIEDMARVFIRAIEACDDFSYPVGFVDKHSWAARAKELEQWMNDE